MVDVPLFCGRKNNFRLKMNGCFDIVYWLKCIILRIGVRKERSEVELCT